MSGFDEGHQSTAQGEVAPTDRRVGQVAKALQQVLPLVGLAGSVSDVFRDLGFKRLRQDAHGPFYVGRVVYATQHLNWYKVQCQEIGVVACCAASLGGLLPIGAKQIGLIPPQSMVLVWHPASSPFGTIISVMPKSSSSVFGTPDNLLQGGMTGVTKEDIHLHWIRELFAKGGTTDFSCGRPVDTTIFDQGIMAETGVGLLVSPFEAMLRVNEMAGLFMSLYDGYVRLAGMNLDVDSPPWAMEAKEDEGEYYYHLKSCVYPWEREGLDSPGSEIFRFNPLKAVQYDLPESTVEPTVPDAQEIARYQEYGGYLGQGHLRFLMAPAESQQRRYSEKKADYGLWVEQIGMEGAYMMRSAKSIFIVKRLLNPVPRRVRLAEDQMTGESLEKKNYRFSGYGTDGDEHVIRQVEIPYDPKHVLQAAGMQDLLAYQYNWQMHHPFHYHREDFHTPDEGDLAPFEASVEQLDFATLTTQEFMQYPQPKQLKIDHRYGNVRYYQRESVFGMLEDGSVILGDGYGSRITMFGGKLRLEAPGDIELVPGKRVTMQGADIILKAHNSVDISASMRDVRIKAEKNLHMLAGNGTKGGVLIEARSKGIGQKYDDLYGEDVFSNGIVLLTKQSEIGILGKDIYIRTGGGVLQNGTITLDASKGAKNIVMQCKNLDIFAYQAAYIWHSPGGSPGHRFAPNTSMIAGNLLVQKSVVASNGHVLAAKSVGAGGHIVAKGYLAHKKPPFVGSSAQWDPSTSFAGVGAAWALLAQAGQMSWNGELNERWYSSEMMLGNDGLLSDMGFSFRDPPGTPYQYRAANYSFPETWWQQLIRLGQATGGVDWVENPVTYQSTATYPYPGRDNWETNEVYVCYKGNTLFDLPSGRCKPRTDPLYEDPKLNGMDLKKMQGNFKVIM